MNTVSHEKHCENKRCLSNPTFSSFPFQKELLDYYYSTFHFGRINYLVIMHICIIKDQKCSLSETRRIIYLYLSIWTTPSTYNRMTYTCEKLLLERIPLSALV